MEEIKAEILYKFGSVTHGLQYDLGSHKSNIICQLCKNKLTTSKTLVEHARHVLKHHPELIEMKQ